MIDMKNSFLIFLMLCLIGMNSYSQNIKINVSDKDNKNKPVSPEFKEKFEKYAIEIRQIVIDEKKAMDVELKKVDLELQNETLTEAEATSKKEAIALEFTEKINGKIEDLEFDLDELIKKQVEHSILNTDVETLKGEQEKKEKETGYKAKNQMVGYLAFGMITLNNGSNNNLNRHLGFSSGIDLGLLYNRQFSSTSPLMFFTGAYLSWRTLRFDDDRLIKRDVDGTVDLVQHTSYLDKSKLRGTYIMVPLGLKYTFSKMKFDEAKPYRDVDKGIGLSVNVFGGFNIMNKNIVQGEGIFLKDKKTNYQLNNIAYGGQVTLSILSWNVFVRQEFSPFFKGNTFDNRGMTQIGINLGF